LNSLDSKLAEPENERGCRGEQKYLNIQAGNKISTIRLVIIVRNLITNSLFVSFSLSLLEMKIIFHISRVEIRSTSNIFGAFANKSCRTAPIDFVVSLCLPVMCPHSKATERILMKPDIGGF
jgi:hypothetical protein